MISGAFASFGKMATLTTSRSSTIIKEALWRTRNCLPRSISAIVNGKRAITADTALRLGKYFGVSAELWLGLQADLDLRIAQRIVGAQIDKQVHARVA
jgi:addiction module HigA family antidote